MDAKISKTVMSHLIQTDFSALQNEVLIEETATPNSVLTAGKDKYVDDSCALEKQPIVDSTAIDESQNNNIDFSDDNDLVYKPDLINADNTDNGGNSGTPSSPGSPAKTQVARTEIIYYNIQNGDTISTIARHFGITVNTILWANNLTAFSVIKPGDRISILPNSGVLYVVKKGDTLAKIAQKYDIEVAKILGCNDLGKSISVGEKIIIPGAKKIDEEAPAVAVVKHPSTPSYTGISVIKDLIKNPGVKVTGNKMTWPTVGHTITQYFGWKHPGVDIANKIGTPLYAADAGVVEFAGWATGYGNSIVINHGGGKKTRYGHASKLFVKVGDEVEKGENIAAMGSTGWSTGPHVHFEVIINGAKYNPLNYIR